MSKNYASNPAILNEARDYLDGLVLGDGNIYCINRKTGLSNNGLYQQACKYKNWLDIISEDLYTYNIECTVTNGRLYTGGLNAKGGSIKYHLWTRTYVEFKELHDRFYQKWYDIDNYPKTRWHKDKDGEYYAWKKIIPKDICLSPACLANEYLGDGSIHKYKHQNYYQIFLATNEFSKEDTIFLADLLCETLDIKCSVTKEKRIGIYNRADISTFLNYIKDYKIDCYSKKFPDELINNE